MIKTPDFQSRQTVHSHAHKSRSAGVSFGRFTERCRTPIWWRSARISSWSAARLRNEAASEAMSAVNMCPNGNRNMSDKLQFINLIGIYGKHNLVQRLCLSGSSGKAIQDKTLAKVGAEELGSNSDL